MLIERDVGKDIVCTWKVLWTDNRCQCSTELLAEFELRHGAQCRQCICGITADSTKGLCTRQGQRDTTLSVFQPLDGVLLKFTLDYVCESIPILSTFGSRVAVLRGMDNEKLQIVVFNTASRALLKTRATTSNTAFQADYKNTLHWHNDVTLWWLAVE